jgi:carboxyl-terminal processing protease
MRRLASIALLLSLTLVTAGAPVGTDAAVSHSAPAMTSQESNELAQSYLHLTTEFYKSVDRKVVLDSVHTNLVAYLQAHCIAKPELAPMHASTDDIVNARELQHATSLAVAAYAAKIGDQPMAKVDGKLAPSGACARYGEKTGALDLTYAAIAGTMASVKDRYTVFLSPHEFAELNEGLDGTDFGGVGLSYDIDNTVGAIHVQNIIPDGPADKAGLESEDVIVAVDGKPVKDLVLAKAVTDLDAAKRADAQQKIVSGLLRGPAGTQVTLTVARDGKELAPIMVTRAIIHSPSVYAKLEPGGIGWIELTVFGADTAQELTSALNRLDAQGAKAYVLDLRYNGGGYLNAAVDVSSKFISSGPIVSQVSRAGTVTEYDAENTAIPARPLVVLVNKGTASASEITAGAIQDSGVGTIMGTQTFGKGVVQSIFALGDGSAVKITTARYLTPHGRDINSVGIKPDVDAPTPPKDTTIRFGEPAKDPQLQQAMTFLQNKIAEQNGTTAQTAVPPRLPTKS